MYTCTCIHMYLIQTVLRDCGTCINAHAYNTCMSHLPFIVQFVVNRTMKFKLTTKHPHQNSKRHINISLKKHIHTQAQKLTLYIHAYTQYMPLYVYTCYAHVCMYVHVHIYTLTYNTTYYCIPYYRCTIVCRRLSGLVVVKMSIH